jgi:ribosomal protein S27AE
MKSHWVPPEERFDNLHVSSVVQDGQALPLTCLYRCPRCTEGVVLTKENLVDRAPRRFSNLPPSVAKKFDEEAGLRSLGAAAFLDWPCPKCGLAVRAYVKPWFGGRHGDSGSDIIALVEEQIASR